MNFLALADEVIATRPSFEGKLANSAAGDRFAEPPSRAVERNNNSIGLVHSNRLTVLRAGLRAAHLRERTHDCDDTFKWMTIPFPALIQINQVSRLAHTVCRFSGLAVGEDTMM